MKFDSVVLAMIRILTAETKGLTDNEGFDNLKILYISQALLLYGCKAFFYWLFYDQSLH
jgi:hypothetical protein